MALGFFRRHQKVVFVIMVLLMVTFLIQFQFGGSGERGPGSVTLGYMGNKKVTLRMREAGERDLHLLETSLGLGHARLPRPGERAFGAFLQLNQEKERGLTWALLVEEAQGMGLRASDAQVTAFLGEVGLTEKDLRQEVAELNLRGYTEEMLRRAVGDYLLVKRAFEAARLTAPPSLPEMQHLFQQIGERIQLALVVFPAEEFIKTAPAPSQKEVQDWFEKYKNFFPNEAAGESDFGFGYRQPDRVDVAWLFVDRQRLLPAVEPTEQQVSDYWQRHKGELTTQAASSAGGEAQTVIIENYTDAKPVIRDLLKSQAVETRMTELVNRASEAVARFGRGADAYARAADSLVHPADPLLGRPCGNIPFRSAPLQDIIGRLEKLAGVRIAYPFGRSEKLSVDGKVLVQVEPAWEKLSLGEILERISGQLKLATIKWATCDGLEGAIFPSEPVNLVPIRAGATGPIDLEALEQDALLGSAELVADRSGGENLVSIAAGVFRPKDAQHAPLIEPGGDFRQAMYVVGQQRGRLLWRLRGSQPAQTPEQLTPPIRQQVEKDLKTVAAFKAAEQAAEALKVKLDKAGAAGDLEKLAAAEKRQAVKTEPFPRVMPFLGQLIPTDIPLPKEPKDKSIGRSPLFLEKAFSLAPADPEPPYADRASAVVALPRKQQVVLIQRIGFIPVTYEDFDTMAVYATVPVLAGERQVRALQVWFAPANVQRRVEWRPKTDQ